MESDNNNDSVVVERGEWREMGYFHEEQVEPFPTEFQLNLTSTTLKISCKGNISGRGLHPELHQDIKASNSFTHRQTATDRPSASIGLVDMD